MKPHATFGGRTPRLFNDPCTIRVCAENFLQDSSTSRDFFKLVDMENTDVLRQPNKETVPKDRHQNFEMEYAS